jgi:citrate lyase subunit beta / citryl-CoA lyase
MHRSYLYVPGDQPALLTKAFNLTGNSRPDAIIIDLEDAVAPTHKREARAAAAALTAHVTPDRPAIFVRINVHDSIDLDDLRAVSGPGLAGVVVPKASPESVATVAQALRSTGHQAAIVALVETAAALTHLNAIAAVPGVTSLALGEADLGSELGIATEAQWAWWPIRMNVVVASGTFGLEAPTGPVSVHFRDLEEYGRTTRDLLHAGFGARPAIHPSQIPIINSIMKPTPTDIEHARQIVDQHERAAANGIGVTTDADGAMTDEAVVRRYRRML